MMPSPSQIADAAARLRAGALVAFPTETVYGLGADAANPGAVARVFALKGRPADHPLIVHLGRAEQLAAWTENAPEAAWRLAERFWPGPLTLVLPKAAAVPPAVTGGQDTIAVRVPGHPVALALLAAFDGGIAAPSANRFGRVSPTTAQHVRDEFGGEAPLVLDGGPCAVGLESTILNLCGAVPAILRPGAITAGDLAGALGAPVRQRPAPEAPRVPGALESHYAPTTPLELVAPDAVAARLAALAGRRVALLAAGDEAVAPGLGLVRVGMPDDAAGYGQRLYATLRRLDTEGFEAIVAVTPPAEPAWQAARDRLWRAAGLGGVHTLEDLR